MRYRKLDKDGDYSFGGGLSDFLENTPECVAQAVKTRLDLWMGEWFANVSDGTGWSADVLGKYTDSMYEMMIRQRILETHGVLRIDDFASQYSSTNRKLTIQVVITTIYGTTSLSGDY